MMRTFLCFDIGGSKYNVGLLRQDGTILARQKSLWHGHSQQEMLAEALLGQQAMGVERFAKGGQVRHTDALARGARRRHL